MKQFSNLPPFTRALISHTRQKNYPFDTPGHHNGDFFRLTKEGREFYNAFGASLFRLDVSDSDFALGDPSSHEGAAGDAEKRAAAAFHADRAWFVTGGTSASNRIVCQSILSKNDLVLFDRNNHKSVYQGALLQAGAIPVYLPSLRNGKGMIGGISFNGLSEDALRSVAAKAAPEKAKAPRPFRLACLQLCTYDGIFANPAFLLEKLGRLCDYILFDAAWAGYEQWACPLKNYSPLTMPLSKEDPGIFVTQSVHKQLAGFSQTSQILKKDSHIKGEPRYVNDDVVDSVFLMNSSTSPYFPLIAGLEMNAFLHEKAGCDLWKRAVSFGITLRKEILSRCRYVKPFLPSRTGNKKWAALPKKRLSSDSSLWALSPDDSWHGFSSLKPRQCMLDPCKILLDTAGGNLSIPAPLLSLYLQDRNITPEKNDWYSLLFLAQPGDTKKKAKHLSKALAAFEQALDDNRPARDVVPSLASRGRLQNVIKKINRFLAENNAVALQKNVFETLPPLSLRPKEAHQQFLKGKGNLVPIKDIVGMTALECAMPYPPGIAAVNAGEVWTKEAADYFLFLDALLKAFPDMAPEMVGVHHLPAEEGGLLCAYAIEK